MRVAHVSATFPPYYAGTGTICLHNARVLADAGHEVTVYTARLGPTEEDTLPGVRVRRLRPQLRVGNAFLVSQLLAMPAVDLVHLHYPFIFGAELVWLLHVLRRQPYVITYHNDLVWTGMKGAAFRAYQTVWSRLVLGGARRVLITSWDFARSSPQLRPFVRRHADRLIEMPNGVDTRRLHPALEGDAVRRQLGLRHAAVTLFVGAMDTAHDLKGGVPTLLRALAKVPDQAVQLVLVGGGDMVPAYRQLARQLGLGGRTHFVGWIPNDQLGPYYAAADVLVVPSVRVEAFGLVAIEALACGTPVVASELPGLRSVVHSTNGGLLVPPGEPDALAATLAGLLADRERRLVLASNGRAAVVQHYDWSVISSRLDAVYRSVLAEPDTRPIAVGAER